MNDAFIRTILLAGLGIAGALSAVVISEEDLEASKPQLEVSQNGNDLDIHWDAQPEVYYFVEGTEDFETWVAGKLLKDIDDDEALSVHPAIESEKKFYRLSLLGDPGDARLRADDDGDKIINLLEADAGWDHLTPSDPADSDNDGIPDYWELFHFGTLEHDATYIAVEGGLTLAEAYAHATDPKSVDSDGDGESDAVEIANGTNPNYDETRDDPNGDYDQDGLTNAQEHAASTFPKDADSDDDLVEDGEDAWPRDKNFTHAPASESYVLIDLSEKLPHPSSGSYDAETFSVQVDDHSGVLLSYATQEVSLGTTSTRNLVNKYYNWNQVIAPALFNGNKLVGESRLYPDSPPNDAYLNVGQLFQAHLTRSGILRLKGIFEYDDFNGGLAYEDNEAFVADLKATFATSNIGFDTQAEVAAEASVITFSDDLLGEFTGSPLDILYLDVAYSEYSDSSLIDANIDRSLSNPPQFDSIVKDEAIIYTGYADGGNSVDSYTYTKSGYGSSGQAVFELTNSREGNTHKFALISDQGVVTALAHTQNGNYAVLSKNGQDILASSPNGGAHEYSLDGGTTFHPALAWNTSTRELEAVSFIGKASDDLVILQNNQTGILINGQIKTATDLLGSQAEGWTDLKLYDINSHDMIVGTAIHSPEGETPTKKVVAMIKMDLDIHQPGTVSRTPAKDDNGNDIIEPEGGLVYEYPLPPEITEAEQQSPTRCPILINDDNDDLDSLFDGSNLADPYPQDNDDSVLKLKEPIPGSTALNDDDVVMVTLRKFDAVESGKIKVTTSKDTDVRFFKYVEGQYNLNAVNVASMVVDLSNPGTTSPLKDLPNEDVSFYIEGINANSDLTVSMIFEDTNGNELARQEVHLEITSTRIISLSAQGNGQLAEITVKNALTKLMQGANIVRRDRDGLDANADVSVPVTFRLGVYEALDTNPAHIAWKTTSSASPEAVDILDYAERNDIDIYVIQQMTYSDSGGFAESGGGCMVIPAQGAPDQVIAHEWLHAFGDTEETIDDANDDGHICIDQHLMKGSGCSDSLTLGSDVRESEKLLFKPY